MPTDPNTPLARQMLSVVLRHGSRDGPADRELLAKFVSDRDEEAFAELVRRHGSMVLAVCRRVTGHAEDAEDAFQAAFIVLARRAGHVSRPELLGNWLYGVAYRTALEARSARRRVKEQHPVSDAPEPAAPTPPDDPADLRRVIDEELARLPEKYRSAVVLCDLEGLNRKDAAGRLRVPEGTLSSRLAYARKALAARLSRRGVTTTAAALATALGRDAAGTTVPHQLIQHTARAAARVTAGGVVPPDVISGRVTTLTDGVMKAMIVNRLRLMTGAGVLALGMLSLGAAAVIGQNPPDPKPVNPFIPVADPFVVAQQSPKEKARGAEKIPAKGIEDDEVPYPSVPTQAVVRLEEGKLVVRQRQRGYSPVTTELDDGRKVTSYQFGTRVSGQKYDPADVSVFDMKGNRVPTKTWKEKLKEDLHVLVAFDGRLPHPRELTLFKDDALLIVFPAHTPGADPVTPPPTPAVPYNQLRRAQANDGSYYFVPPVDYGVPAHGPDQIPPAPVNPAAPYPVPRPPVPQTTPPLPPPTPTTAPEGPPDLIPPPTAPAVEAPPLPTPTPTPTPTPVPPATGSRRVS
ncbi:MAG: sigE 46 [Gemmataceae bacterium]|nr:sigE 46 [Gemmataceae bacterium]